MSHCVGMLVITGSGDKPFCYISSPGLLIRAGASPWCWMWTDICLYLWPQPVLSIVWELHCQALEGEVHTLSCLTPSGSVGHSMREATVKGMTGFISDPGRGGDYLGYLPKQERAF